MLKRLFVIITLGVTVSGCFVAPLAFIGPVTSGFSTASLIQSGVTTGAGYVVKQATGKTITELAIESINTEILQQTYFPKTESKKEKHTLLQEFKN